MEEGLDKLRDEIIESEKARYDMMKWKLVLVAGLGAAGLGLSGNSVKNNILGNVSYILCLIPLVSVYVDVLCYHMNLRIMVIGTFLGKVHGKNCRISGYEEFADAARRMNVPNTQRPESPNKSSSPRISAYPLEDWALRWSTIVLCALIVFYGSLAHTCDNLWLLVTAVGIVCGLLVGFVVPYVWHCFPNKRWARTWVLVLALAILSMAPLVIILLVFVFVFVSDAVQELLPLMVFLTFGLVGFLLTGIMTRIYSIRTNAIEDLPNYYCMTSGAGERPVER